MIDLSKFKNPKFSRGVSRGTEVLWWICRSLFFAPWFPLPSKIKVMILRIFGAKIGERVVIRSRVNITFPWRVEIADHVWIGDEVIILSLAPVRIGSHSCVSQRAFICTGSHDFSRDSFDLVTREIEIGESCWIGAQSFVGPGVSVGDGSRCLAGAVVVKDVANDQVVGGVPAKVLK